MPVAAAVLNEGAGALQLDSIAAVAVVAAASCIPLVALDPERDVQGRQLYLGMEGIGPYSDADMAVAAVAVGIAVKGCFDVAAVAKNPAHSVGM